MDNAHYVYIVFRLTGEPCYVGQGKGGRWKKHVKRSHNIHLAHIFAQANGKLPIVIIREHLARADALALEMQFIAAIGREVNGGPLVNQTDGGDGGHGAVWSVAQRARRSDLTKAMWANPEHRASQIANRKQRKHSEATRVKMREIAARPDVAAARRKGLDASRGRPHTPESLAKLRGREFSEETRAKMRESSAKRWAASAEERAAVAAARKEAAKTGRPRGRQKGHVLTDRERAAMVEMGLKRRGVPCPESTRRAVGEANRKRVISPETRRKQSAAGKGRVMPDYTKRALVESRILRRMARGEL